MSWERCCRPRSVIRWAHSAGSPGRYWISYWTPTRPSEPDLVQDRHITVDARAAYFEELLDRNSSLAAALGACDCWGAAPHCPICEGEGSPGWMLPDRELFKVYVQPALSIMTNVEPNA